mgnify:CR=1 FL=1
MDERAGAHRTRFFCDEEIAIAQPPIAHRRFRLRQSQHLGVSGGVLEHLDLIKSARDYFAVAHDYGAEKMYLEVRPSNAAARAL